MFNRIYLSLIVITIFLLSCNTADEQVTPEEANVFATALISDAHRQRVGFISENIIVPVFLEKVKETPGIIYDDAFEKELTQQLNSKTIEKQIAGVLSADGSFEKVRLYEKDGRQRVIVRLFSEELNYLDIELGKRNGKVGIADFFVYRTGNWFSHGWAGTVFKLWSEKRNDDYDIINQRLEEVKMFLKTDDFAAARTSFEGLPGYLQSAKAPELTYLIILSGLGDRDYLREIEAFEKKYKDDPYTAINYIDLHFFNKDYYAALESINTLDSLVGGDPFINYYRGIVYNSLDDAKTATGYFEQLVKDEPTFSDGYLELFAIHNSNNDKVVAKEYFTQYRKQKTADTVVVAYFEKLNPYLKKH